MEIQNDHVIRIHYKLTNDAGELIDQSEKDSPLTFLQGKGQIIPGLEEALLGKVEGNTFDVSIPPEKGYGPYHQEMTKRIPLDSFPEPDKLEVGVQFEVTIEGSPILLTILEIGDDVLLDANHPLAGKTLHFNINVVEVREATEEELQHGHAHGPGGAHN